MPVRFRVIVAFLFLALPLQGMAVASSVPCSGSHGHAALTNPALAPLANVHDGHHAAHGATAMNAHENDGGASLPGGESGASAAPSGADRCAHCAACSVGSAILDSTIRVVALDAAWVGFLPKRVTTHPRPFGGPERPPRAA